MARIYVAGKFEEKEAVRTAQRALIAAGHTITHDWTKEDATGKTGAVLSDYLTQCALADYEGVLESEAVVVLNHNRNFGAMVELGMALAWGRVCFVVGPEIRDSIFWSLPTEMGMRTFATLDQAIDALNEAELHAFI